MTYRRDYRTMISQGRKAGLHTTELYQAMSSLPREAGEPQSQGDGNGFVSSYGTNGQRVFVPMNRPAGS